MVASDAEKKLLEMKKDRIRRAILLVCKFNNVDPPKINFKGCTHEWKNEGGIQLAHYHSGMICVSERQLKLEHLGDGLEETAVHEVMHHLGFNHNTNAKRRDFEKRKNQVMRALWKELRAPLPTKEGEGRSIKRVQPSVEQKRQELESEVRILISQLDDASGEARLRILDQIEAAKRELHKISSVDNKERPIIKEVNAKEPSSARVPHVAMTKSQIEESRKKLGIEESKSTIKPTKTTVKTEPRSPPRSVVAKKHTSILSKMKNFLEGLVKGFKTQIISGHCYYCGDNFDDIVRPQRCPSCGHLYCSNPCINIHRC